MASDDDGAADRDGGVEERPAARADRSRRAARRSPDDSQGEVPRPGSKPDEASGRGDDQTRNVGRPGGLRTSGPWVEYPHPPHPSPYPRIYPEGVSLPYNTYRRGTSAGAAPGVRSELDPPGRLASSFDERARLAHLDEVFRRLQQDPLGVATVACLDGDRMILSMGPSGLVEVARHAEARVGDTAVVDRGSLQVIRVVHEAVPPGVVAHVVGIDADAVGVVCVDVSGARREVHVGNLHVKLGDRLVLEPSLVYAVASLGRPTLASAEAVLATVACVEGKRMVLSVGSAGLVQVPRHATARVGDTAVVDRGSLQVIEVTHEATPPGIVAQVVELDAVGGVACVEIGGVRRSVRTTGLAVRAGDRLVVESSLTYAVACLGRPPAAHADVVAQVEVSWDDVGGQEAAKEQLRETVELPYEHPELYRAYNKRPPRGVLLYGPPGTGKTLLGKATATSLGRRYGRASLARGGFVYVKGPEVVTKWVGETEGQIRALFDAAREFRREHGYPAVLFFDEADALFGQRDRGPTMTLSATVVPQFLAEMDGLEDSEVVLLLASNRPDLLDAAVTREGRVDRKIRVERPSPDDAVRILQIHLRGIPTAPGEDAGAIARRVVDRLYEPGSLRVRDYGPVQLELRHLVGGALLAEVVRQATTAALRRDVEEGRVAEAGGLRGDDLVAALESIRRGQRDLDHGQVLYELAEVQGTLG